MFSYIIHTKINSNNVYYGSVPLNKVLCILDVIFLLYNLDFVSLKNCFNYSVCAFCVCMCVKLELFQLLRKNAAQFLMCN